MIRDFFGLTDDHFLRLQPLLPTDTRGKPRLDDRQVISGIVHVLKSGRPLDRRARRLCPEEDALQPLRPLGPKGVWVDIFHVLAAAGGPPAEVLIDSPAVQSASARVGRQRGERTQAIGRSRGGRTTKRSDRRSSALSSEFRTIRLSIGAAAA
jgi:transposase